MVGGSRIGYIGAPLIGRRSAVSFGAATAELRTAR